MRLIDVSQPLGPETAAWPGDRPFTLDWTLRREAGDAVDVAAIALSVHTGTHVDGPMHTGEGPGAGALPPEPFVGPAVVVDGRPFIDGSPPRVGPGVLDGVDPAATPRVLIRTRDAVDPTVFPAEVAALSPALARALVERGFVLVGTDAPSVDPVDSTELETHRILAAGGIPNVENLVLSGVEAGRYVFIALPLRLEGADSSPVRAVLLESDEI
jgi:arylformamidase